MSVSDNVLHYVRMRFNILRRASLHHVFLSQANGGDQLLLFDFGCSKTADPNAPVI